MRWIMAVLAVLITISARPAAAREVTLGKGGIVRVDGRPFFPVGIFPYELNGSVLADIHDLQFNTVVCLSENIHPADLDTLKAHGLMAVAPTNPTWFPAVKDHPALLAWCLTDEPEGHGNDPASERKRYLDIKAADPRHPIGLDHFLWEALEKYKDACDFTMTDVYPITANRDVPVTNVGKFIDEARRIHGPDWSHWSYIQVFGGPDTEGGKWAQPLPSEVRCMTYIALVHRANGILYFSYWPKAPRTWESLGPLNREIHRMAPWLVADGAEMPAFSSNDAVQVRARHTYDGGILIAVNTSNHFVDADLSVKGLRARRLDGLFAPGMLPVKSGKVRESFGPYDTRVYTWGTAPDVTMARG